MKPEDIERRWAEVNRELADIADGKVVDGSPVECEGRLLEELDELEYEAGEYYFTMRHERE